jgi:hypothetical protein
MRLSKTSISETARVGVSLRTSLQDSSFICQRIFKRSGKQTRNVSQMTSQDFIQIVGIVEIKFSNNKIIIII